MWKLSSFVLVPSIISVESLGAWGPCHSEALSWQSLFIVPLICLWPISPHRRRPFGGCTLDQLPPPPVHPSQCTCCSRFENPDGNTSNCFHCQLMPGWGARWGCKRQDRFSDVSPRHKPNALHSVEPGEVKRYEIITSRRRTPHGCFMSSFPRVNPTTGPGSQPNNATTSADINLRQITPPWPSAFIALWYTSGTTLHHPISYHLLGEDFYSLLGNYHHLHVKTFIGYLFDKLISSFHPGIVDEIIIVCWEDSSI